MIDTTQETSEMKGYFKAIKKLKSQKGSTMVELLCVCLILGIMGGAIVTGMQISAKEYTKVLRGTEKDVLYSTLEYVMSYELQNSCSVTVDSEGNVVDFQGKTYGKEDYSVDDSHLTRTFYASSDGKILYGLPGGAKGDYQTILSSNAYPDGMSANVTALTYDSTTHYFTVGLDILYRENTVLSETFNVLNLYEVNASLRTS